jgi:CMP-N,N'-diacetyllegionaminic acid synthase
MADKGVLIVVPARGGSKGLLRKNARSLGDLPLLGWTAKAVRAAGLANYACMLSTDDEEIAAIGRSVGLDVPFMRPPELATDEASAESVAVHALDWLAAERGIHPAAVMWLQPTSPFRNPESLRQAMAMLAADDTPGVIGVKPVYRSLKTLFNTSPQMDLLPLDAGVESANRRQMLQPLYTPNGALYLVRSGILRSGNSFFPPGIRGIVMDQIASIDIDDSLDWSMAVAIAAAGLTWRGARLA